MKYRKVEDFLSENTLFLNKKCKKCTGLLEPVDFTTAGINGYKCQQCQSRFSKRGKEMPAYDGNMGNMGE